MPIYAYKCGSCGHAKDVLQKISDAPLTACPSCGADSFSKQVTAAGFQLKGSGWYVTDFRGGNSAGAAPAAAPAVDKPADKPAEAAKSDASPSPKPDAPSASAGVSH
jgi:putative FmdB family regulatory protein